MSKILKKSFYFPILARSIISLCIILLSTNIGITDETKKIAPTIDEQISLIREKRAKYELEINSLIQDKTENEKEEQFQTKKLSLYHSLSSIFPQQVAVLQNISQLKEKTKETLIPELGKENINSFLELENLKNNYLNLVDKTNAAKESVEIALDALDTAEKKYTKSDKLRRLLKEKLESSKSEEEKKSLLLELQIVELENTANKEFKLLREFQVRFAKINSEYLSQYKENIYQKIKSYNEVISFSKKDFEFIINQLEKEEEALNKALVVAESSLEKAQREYQKYKKNTLEKSKVEEEAATQALLEVSQLRQQLVAVKRDDIDRIRLLTELWHKRSEVLQKLHSKEERNLIRADITRQIENQTYTENELSKGLVKLQKELIYLSPDKPFYALNRKAIEDLLNAKRSSLQQVERFKLFLRNFLNEINASLPVFDWLKFYNVSIKFVIDIWNYEIFSTSDDRPITVRKLIIGLFLLFFGYIISKYLSRLFVKRILNKFKLDEGAVAAIQTILFYLLIVLFTLFALHIANVPLTIFTVLGGALAIGVGFGSQNIVNNFISGLILFTERPIKVGDLLDLDGSYGRVKSIGARSTVIRTSANIDLIVPNSSFLEKNVINWTRNDTNVRLRVTVGVVYGSPTEKVKELLIQAVSGTSKLVRQRETIVLFSDFGDNALIFDVHFWAQVKSHMDRQVIESEVRFKIDALFRENEIIVAFPQRDIHLDTLKPLEVKILPEAS